jgi:sulfur carrier protein
MKISVNGQPFEIDEGLSVAGLIDLLNLSGKRVALEINQETVPRSRFEIYHLQAEDRIEIVHAIGGG